MLNHSNGAVTSRQRRLLGAAVSALLVAAIVGVVVVAGTKLLPASSHKLRPVAARVAASSPSTPWTLPVGSSGTKETMPASKPIAMRTASDALAAKAKAKSPSKVKSSSTGQRSHTTQARRPARAVLVYTVKPGDTLSGIATWFRLHGYVNLYRWNWTELTHGPNLIFPGEVIRLTPPVT